jgi:hypothetical protein
MPKLLELLQRDDRCYSTLIQPHLFKGSQLATRVHSARSSIAVADEPASLLLHMFEKMGVGRTAVVCTLVNVNVHMVGGENASHSFLLLLHKPVTLIGKEQIIVFFVAVVDIDVMDAFFQCL